MKRKAARKAEISPVWRRSAAWRSISRATPTRYASLWTWRKRDGCGGSGDRSRAFYRWTRGIPSPLRRRWAGICRIFSSRMKRAAKAAIRCLAEHKAGRTTFYPLAVMRPERLLRDPAKLSRMRGYVGSQASFCRFDEHDRSGDGISSLPYGGMRGSGQCRRDRPFVRLQIPHRHAGRTDHQRRRLLHRRLRKAGQRDAFPQSRDRTATKRDQTVGGHCRGEEKSAHAA